MTRDRIVSALLGVLVLAGATVPLAGIGIWCGAPYREDAFEQYFVAIWIGLGWVLVAALASTIIAIVAWRLGEWIRYGGPRD